MTKQLTPAEELRCYYKAATILAEMLASQSYGDCPDPEQFNPAGKCAHPSPELYDSGVSCRAVQCVQMTYAHTVREAESQRFILIC